MHTANLNHEARTGWQEGRKTNCMSLMNDYSAWQARCAMSASEVARWVERRESCKGWRFYFHCSVMYRERWRQSCSYWKQQQHGGHIWDVCSCALTFFQETSSTRICRHWWCHAPLLQESATTVKAMNKNINLSVNRSADNVKHNKGGTVSLSVAY